MWYCLIGVIEVAEGVDERTCRTNPIRCRVAGGYTISKRSGYGADSSPETLLTCILQVRMTGMCGRFTSGGCDRIVGGYLEPCDLQQQSIKLCFVQFALRLLVRNVNE